MISTLSIKRALVCLFIFIYQPTLGQKDDYTSLLTITKENAILKKRIEDALYSDLHKTSSLSKSIKKELNESLSYRKEFILELINNGIIIDDSLFTSYYQNILNNILKANPFLDQNIKIYITRFTDPNAFNTGDGNIYFHLGLLKFLETEEQIAFVIAHELSHQYLNHTYNKLLLSISTIKSDEVQQKIRKANRQTYGSKEALKEISNNLVFDIKKHGREKESEADSMAIVFLKNTSYSIEAAISALDILDKIEESELKLRHIKFSEHFQHLPITPRKEWDDYNADTTYASARESNKKIPDSLKTHPDCQQRALNLKKNFNSLLSQNKQKSAIAYYYKDRNKAKLEYLLSCIYQENIGLSIHENIRLLELDSTNDDLKLMLARNFALINYHQRNRTLGTILEFPSDVYPVEYNYTLSFLNELKTIESAAIAYFTLKSLPTNEENEEYLYTSILCHYAYKKFDVMQEQITVYNKLFNKGKYTEELSQLSLETNNSK